jgi:hypothetical protein
MTSNVEEVVSVDVVGLTVGEGSTVGVVPVLGLGSVDGFTLGNVDGVVSVDVGLGVLGFLVGVVVVVLRNTIRKTALGLQDKVSMVGREGMLGWWETERGALYVGRSAAAKPRTPTAAADMSEPIMTTGLR